MASLRARLLVALLALTAVGLLLAGGITYYEQRSFELDRVDAQARTAGPAVDGALAEKGIGNGHHGGIGEPGGPREGGPGPRGAPGAGLPPGTYGQLRDAAGNVVGSQVWTYNQDITANPALPADMPLGRVFMVRDPGSALAITRGLQLEELRVTAALLQQRLVRARRLDGAIC